jgi:hypothetical protein
MIRGGNRSYHHRSGNRNGERDRGLGPRGGNRYHDDWDVIHHRSGRRLQFRPGLDHRGLGPRGGNRYHHDDWDDIHHRSGRRLQFRPGLDHRGLGPHGGGNSNSQEV